MIQPEILRIRIDKTARAGTLVKSRFCNIDCVWCHHDFFNHEASQARAITNEDFEHALKMLLDASAAKKLDVRLAGDGDPTIVGVDELCDLIVRLRQLPVPVEIKMTTNGILFGGMAERLKAAGLDGVTISLNSLSRELYHFYAGDDRLEDVLNSIEVANKVGIQTKINVIYSRLNHHEIDDFMALSRRYSGMTVKFFDLLVEDDLSKRLYLPLERLETYLQPFAERITTLNGAYLRRRYELAGGAVFEVKIAGQENNCPNMACTVRDICLEGCRTAVRVGLDGVLKPCGVRTDNIVDLFNPRTTIEHVRAGLYSGGKLGPVLPVAALN